MEIRFNETVCGIYSIKNLISNKYYVGQSIDIYWRWYGHICALHNGKHHSSHLQRSWNKYGEEKFCFSIIERCKPEELNEKEKYWIAELNSFHDGYNMTPGGDDYKYLKRFLDNDECEIYSRSEVHSNLRGQEVLVIIDRLLQGDHPRLIAADYNVDVLVINSIRYHHTWNYLTKDIKFDFLLEKPIDVYTKDGEFLGSYPNGRIASSEYNCDYRLVSGVCHGKRNATNGYVFRFEGDAFDKYPWKDRSDSIRTPVDQYDTEWHYIRSFKSQREVTKILGIRIDPCIQKRSEFSGGYRWLKSSEQPPIKTDEQIE